MQRATFACPALLVLALVAGCGAGHDGNPAATEFAGENSAPADRPAPVGTGTPPTTDGSVPSPALPGDEDAAGEGSDPDLELEPTGAAETPVTTGMDMPAVQFGNGRIVGGNCTLVCDDASTDPDAQGNTDGWGYEHDRSCLVPGSALELDGQLCDIPELAPLPPIDVIIPEGNTPRPPDNFSTGFFVSGGRLFDRSGADFIMRGINHPVAWFQNDALDWMDEIATTDANSVRIVWETTAGSTQILRASIERAIALGMVPMVELHDETSSNDPEGPTRLARYYADEMRDILDDFEPYLLLNIANEWGDWFSTAEEWLRAYRPAISLLRDAGVNHTIVIDANDNGQRGATIVGNGTILFDYDPQHNILFSTHMYQAYENRQAILDVIRGALAARLPLIVGEFGFQHGNRNGQPIPVPYEVMLDEAARVGVGYLAWSWTGNSDQVAYLDMTENGSASQLTAWGDDIINGQNGIRSTSKVASIFASP